MDLDEELLLRHFCLDEECKQVLAWCKEHGHERPEEDDDRMRLADQLKQQGNAKFQESEFQSAMMCALAALHCIDFNQARQFMQTDAQKEEVKKVQAAILSNLSIVFLKRGDAYNSTRAADLGL